MFNATGIKIVSCHYFIISYDDEIKDFNKRDCNSGNKEEEILRWNKQQQQKDLHLILQYYNTTVYSCIKHKKEDGNKKNVIISNNNKKRRRTERNPWILETFFMPVAYFLTVNYKNMLSGLFGVRVMEIFFYFCVCMCVM